MGMAVGRGVVGGLMIFKLPAVEMLAAAIGFGAAGQLLAYLLWRSQIPRPQASPLIAAVFGVALVGAGAVLSLTIAVAAAAASSRAVPARGIPASRAQSCLLAHAAFALV